VTGTGPTPSSDLQALDLEQTRRRLEEVTGKHEKLSNDYRALKRTMQKQIHKRLRDETTFLDTFKEFSQNSMATIVGWITAKTAGLALDEFFKQAIDDAKVVDVLSRAVYVVFVLIAVPLLDWLLHQPWILHSPEQGGFKADQVRLVKICQPMFSAWGLKDLVQSLLNYAGNTFWSTLVASVIITAVLVVVQLTPCFRWAFKNVNDGKNNLVARMLHNLSNLGLAVGFAWNSVFEYGPNELINKVRAPMFALMIQVLYYFLVSTIIVWIIAKVSDEHEDPKPGAKAGDKEDVEKAQAAKHDAAHEHLKHAKTLDEVGDLAVHFAADVGDEVADASRDVLLKALHFVYAWAQLDTIEALYFTYLLQCSGPATCSYQSNFAFALAATFIFGRVAAALKLEKQDSEWNRVLQDLTIKALSLNTGWAWASYCRTAVLSAVAYEDQVTPLGMYAIFTAFAWVCISILHHRLEIERRHWNKVIQKEAGIAEIPTSASRRRAAPGPEARREG